jgi:succinate dehydrogenase/fumarate reductase flavoprotein subunit
MMMNARFEGYDGVGMMADVGGDQPNPAAPLLPGSGRPSMPEMVTSVNESAIGPWDRSADVIVVGQGIAGTCAALEAKRAGAEVLVIERASGGGGASSTSAGVFYLGGGTDVQRACGYADSAENMAKFLLANTSNPDEALLRRFCEGSVEHFHWLEAQGVPFERSGWPHKVFFPAGTECLFFTGNEKVWPYREIAEPVPRGHKAAGIGETGGAVAMNALLARCEVLGIPALYNSRVVALVVNGAGRVTGVRVRQGGAELHVQARRGVILAAGGFNLNEAMARENIPLLSETSVPIGIPYNDGGSILPGRSAGATVQSMDGVLATAPIYPPEQLIKGIIVNRSGVRFVAEDSYHGRVAQFAMEQLGQSAYLIVDSEIFTYPEMTACRHALIDGWDTVAEMERGLGMPEGSLQCTVDVYNRDAVAGIDTQFQKHADSLKPLDVGPYAAFDISFNKSIYVYMTLGGLRSGLNGEALDSEGQPIGGLYAVGACAAHLSPKGDSYASGLSLAPGSFFGRMAGRHAAGQVDAS